VFFPTKKLRFVTSIYQVMNRSLKYKISFSSWLASNCLIWVLVMEPLKSHRKFLIHHPEWISVLRKPIQVIISGYGCPLDIDPNLKFWAGNVYETKYRSEICIKYNGFRTYSRIEVKYIRKVLRPAISTQVFLGFLVSIRKCWDGSQDSKLPLHGSHVALPN